MGTLLFDYLLDSPLFEAGSAKEPFAGSSDADILLYLRDYRDFVLKNIDTLNQEAQGNDSSLRILAPQDEISIDLLRNLSLYVQQFLLRDPLFPFTDEPREVDLASSKVFHYRVKSLSRHRLAETIKYLKLLQPFVAANYVKILPFSYLRERPIGIPIYFDPDNFAKVLPQETMKFIRDHALVESMVKIEDGGWRTDGALYPCRSIYVTFEGHRIAGGMLFQLANQEVLGLSEQQGPNVFRALLTYPEDPPALDHFRVWVDHSINRTALNLYDELMLHNTLAARYQAAYLTDSPFSFGLLQRSVTIEPSIPTDTVNQLLRFNLSYLDNVASEDLMRIRLAEGEAFESFRLAIERSLREIRLEKNPEAANLLLENALHELCEVQVQEVSRKVDQLKTRFFIDATLLGGSLVAAVQQTGWGIPAVALAAVGGYRTYKEYQQNVRENPAFFLWKVKGNTTGSPSRSSG
jgi:hypothetical protein